MKEFAPIWICSPLSLLRLYNRPFMNSTAPSKLILDMVHHNPGEARYVSKYQDPEVLAEMGFNGKVFFLFDSPSLAINWESVDPQIFPPGSEGRQWVDEKAASLREEFQKCRAAGVEAYAMGDLVLFPKALIERFGIEESFGDPLDPKTDELLRSMVNQIFTEFPDFAGFVVRIGETYLEDAPHHRGSILNKTDADKTIIPLIQLLREEICVKHGKTLIFRTWVSFDCDLEIYKKVSAAIEPHPKLKIGVKHCEGDFHRSNEFSKVIGEGRHPQVIEVQCAREYEGKGAYPNYIAHGVIEGFEEHAFMPTAKIRSLRDFVERKPVLFAGVWTWSRGGGWEGPFIGNELWCDVNAWVMAQWAGNPAESEESILHRYAVNRLGLAKDQSPLFRRLCLASAEAVVRGRNSTHGDMNPWWTRDAGIAWPVTPKDATARARNLAQKDEAIKLWKEIVDISHRIVWPDEETRKFAIASAEYGLRLFEIYRAIVFLSDAEARDDRSAIVHWLETYDSAWAHYNKLPAEYPEAGTLYTQAHERWFSTETAHLHVTQLKDRQDRK